MDQHDERAQVDRLKLLAGIVTRTLWELRTGAITSHEANQRLSLVVGELEELRTDRTPAADARIRALLDAFGVERGVQH